VAKVMAVVKSRRYDGLDFNYERLALTTSPVAAAKVRSSFNAFIKEVCSALRSAGKQCVVTVMPRTDDSYAVWRSKLIPGVYDYAVLGAASTKLRVMAYDQHAPNTSAGPIAGYPWTAAIARYTKSKVAASKVEMGVPLYGRNWASGRVDRDHAPGDRTCGQVQGEDRLRRGAEGPLLQVHSFGGPAHGLVYERDVGQGSGQPGTLVRVPERRAMGARHGGLSHLGGPSCNGVVRAAV
jgi:hypothetical protein